MFGSSLPRVVCRMSNLRYLCLLTYSPVQHILCCVVLFFFVFVYVTSFSVLSIFCIALSVFSNVYLLSIDF